MGFGVNQGGREPDMSSAALRSRHRHKIGVTVHYCPVEMFGVSGNPRRLMRLRWSQTVFDFNSKVYFGPFVLVPKGVADVYRTDCFLATDRLPAQA
jgi:hypothetical protein